MGTKRTWHLTNFAGNHRVQVCQNDISQAEAVTHYIQEGLLNNEAVIVFARPALRRAVMSKMDGLGLDVQTFKSQGQIKFFDAEFLLSSFLIEGELEDSAFQEFIGLPIQAAQLKFGKVRAFGEMVNVLWKRGQYDTAMQLEDFWNDLSKKLEFSLLCSYSMDNLDPNAYDDSLELICKCHKHLVPVEEGDLSESTADDGAMLDVFGAAWNRVMGKLAESKKISEQMSSAQTTLLN